MTALFALAATASSEAGAVRGTTKTRRMRAVGCSPWQTAWAATLPGTGLR